MSIEDNDRFYNLKEEDHEIDNSPLNYAAYTEDDRDGSEEVSTKKHISIKALFHIMFNPVEGWKALRRSQLSVESLQSSCFYPLLSILAVSKFAVYFYNVNVNLSQVITEAVVAFVAYFFGYFCTLMTLPLFISKDASEKFEEKFGKQYIIIALSTLVLFSIVTDLLPMIWPILIFLPIWTLYLMFKAVRFFKLSEKEEIKFFIISSVMVIGYPLLIDWGLNSVMPY